MPLSERDRAHISLYEYLLEPDSLSAVNDTWRSPAEKFYFYAKLLVDVQEQDGATDRAALLPLPLLKRHIALSSGKLLQYANEYEKISQDAGILQTVGGVLGIAGGVLSLTGLVLAPFTLGGSLVLTSVSVALGAAGSAVLLSAAVGLPGDAINTLWERHYMAKSRAEAEVVMKQVGSSSVI